ncbi:hypothetical protein RND71_041621 [Anisodus tanguticus]|uniref:Uncharacterized protein n=1 Tax=Anisodus tanguticus TaxID=243964 RepID=A0AAE1QVR5_9SOLA|nr:hypothetical protein RND71_041621 [Anisodus tanguticus]
MASSSKIIELSPWDILELQIDYFQTGLLFLRPTFEQVRDLSKATNTSSLIDHHRASLSRALDLFPPFCGRLDTTKDEKKTALLSSSIVTMLVLNSTMQLYMVLESVTSWSQITIPTCQQNIFIEYIMLDGVNDEEQQAHQLGKLLETFQVVSFKRFMEMGQDISGACGQLVVNLPDKRSICSAAPLTDIEDLRRQ